MRATQSTASSFAAEPHGSAIETKPLDDEERTGRNLRSPAHGCQHEVSGQKCVVAPQHVLALPTTRGEPARATEPPPTVTSTADTEGWRTRLNQACNSSSSRFDLVTAGHHFLLRVLPFRNPASRDALFDFIETVHEIRLPLVDIDAVLIRCLSVLTEHTGGRIPGLVDLYVSKPLRTRAECLQRFVTLIEDLLQYQDICDPMVQEAVALIARRSSDGTLTPSAVAQALGTRLSTLTVGFKRQTGKTPGEYIRELRLQRATRLLATTPRSIKEVWANVGYNHAANFAHDFKRRFKMSPRQYRATAVVPLAREHYVFGKDSITAASTAISARPHCADTATVLLIDSDESTRLTIATHLRHAGYLVSTVADGTQALVHLPRLVPRVVLLEYRLPDMDGLECLRRIRALRVHPSPAIALFTADWNIFDRSNEVTALGAVAVSKLCDLENIGQLVASLGAEPRRRPEVAASNLGNARPINSGGVLAS